MTSALALSLLLAGAAREAPAASPVPVAIKWEKNFEEALKKAKKAGKPIIVDFWADWCGWCHRLDRTTYADPWVARKAQDFVAVKVNTEGSRKELDVALKYHVAGLPTIVFLSPEGRQVGRLDAFQGPGQFPRTLDTALAAARAVMSWEEALARNPDDSGAYLALGNHLFEQEYFEESRDLLK
ncbi:MAG TPA: thioredoxin family protein, partial [Vicinamibacteria bacterium]